MNIPLLLAGILTLVAAVFHIAVGEREIFASLEPDHLPSTRIGDGLATKQMLRGIWHMWAASWIVAAVLFLLFADDPVTGTAEATVRVLAATFAAYSIPVFLQFRFRHPGSFGFALIAVLAGWGTL